jgi:hypothetical protein
MLIKPRIDRELISTTGQLPDGLMLFQDCMPLQVLDYKKALTESVNDKGQKISVPIMRCTGVFQRAEEKNANGRIYPLDVLREAVDRIQPTIRARGVLGEYDHPIDAKIHLDRASHLITKCWMDGKICLGELEVINDIRMPCGGMLACLLERKIRVGISSRGVGDMQLVMHEGEDAYRVDKGYEVITFDVVSEPSVVGTQLRIMESRNRETRKKTLKEANEKLLAMEIKKYFSI